MPLRNQSGWHESDVFTSEDADRFISLYVDACLNEDWTHAPIREKWVSAVLFDRLDLMTDEKFEKLVLPFLEMTTVAGRSDTGGWVFGAIHRALTLPECPASVLAKACRCGNRSYAKMAAENPNCPEEDSVYVVLQNWYK